MTVQMILSRKGTNVLTVEPTTTISAAARVLAEHGIGALVVSSGDGRTDGIVSERDLVRAISKHGAAALDLPVSDVMTRKVVSCGKQDKLVDIMQQMSAGHFRHMPVVENGRLIGIISIGDVVKRRIEQIEQESNQLREYIRSA